MKPQFINKLHFFEYGKIPPKSISNYSKIIDEMALIDLRQYIDRADAKQTQKDQSFFSYVSSRPGATLTYTSDGSLDNAENIKLFNQKLKNYFCKNGNLFWSGVISLPDKESAIKYNLIKGSDWDLLMKKIFPRFCKRIGIDYQNTVYFLNMHVNTDNPHIHFVFLEKTQLRTRGKITESQLKYLNELIASELLKRNPEYHMKKENIKKQFQDKDSLKQQLVKKAMDCIEEDTTTFQYLLQNLPQKGRLQINAYHVKDYKSMILSYAAELLYHPLHQELFQQFKNKIEEIEKGKTALSNQEYQTIYQNELQKIKTQIANQILAKIKHDRMHTALQNQQVELICNKKIVYESRYYDSMYVKVRIPYTKQYFRVHRDQMKMKSNKYHIILRKAQSIQVVDYTNNQHFTYSGEQMKTLFSTIEQEREERFLMYQEAKSISKNTKQKKEKIFLSKHNFVKETNQYVYFTIGKSSSVVQVPKQYLAKYNQSYYTLHIPAEAQLRFASNKGKRVFMAKIDKINELKDQDEQEKKRRQKRKKMVNTTFELIRQALNVKKENYHKKEITR